MTTRGTAWGGMTAGRAAECSTCCQGTVRMDQPVWTGQDGQDKVMQHGSSTTAQLVQGRGDAVGCRHDITYTKHMQAVITGVVHNGEAWIGAYCESMLCTVNTRPWRWGMRGRHM
jgi:hypothetical protein